MKKPVCALFALVAFASVAAPVSLFNGKDLSGWTGVLDMEATGGYTAQEPTWFVKDGAIRTTGTPFGYLKTKRSCYGDFRLTLKYRWWRKTQSPNSGIFLRLVSENSSFIPRCYENQLCIGRAGEFLGLSGMPIDGFKPMKPFNSADSLSGIIKVDRKAPSSEKPFGEWNLLEIELKGDTLVNRVNGVEQNSLKGLAAGAGAIALQSEGGAIEFKDIFLEEFATAK